MSDDPKIIKGHYPDTRRDSEPAIPKISPMIRDDLPKMGPEIERRVLAVVRRK
jgi:hypothetical protein